ncbi:hypothetical protein J7J90_03915 [Candidatus Micrarchaeota archaeon]|nr:hypothetical protein [Candidatus Micrarchaeota archaeon]
MKVKFGGQDLPVHDTYATDTHSLQEQEPLVDNVSSAYSQHSKKQVRMNIISAIQTFVKKRGYIPRRIDWNEERKYNDSLPSLYVVYKVIGSWRKALSLAGYSPKRQGAHANRNVIRNKIIMEGLLYYKLNNRFPSSPEWIKFHKQYNVVSRQWIYVIFKNWNDFISHLQTKAKVSDDELKEQITTEFLSIVDNKHFIPSYWHWLSLYQQNMVSVPPSLIRKLFGSYNKLLHYVKYKLEKTILESFESFLEDNLLEKTNESFKLWVEQTDVSYRVVKAVFGSWKNLKRVAGVKTKKEIEKLKRMKNKEQKIQTIKQNLISALLTFVSENGYIPNRNDWVKELKNNPALPLPSKIYHYFGKWDFFLVEAGFDVLMDVAKYPNTKESAIVIKQLRMMRKIIGKVPSPDDWKLNTAEYNLVDVDSIIEMFGDWQSAVNCAGLV